MLKLKSLPNQIWAFDVEWTPDPKAGRLLYKIPETATDREVLQIMWKEGGATDENPQPFLKTVLCKIVSLSVLIRKFDNINTNKVMLLTLPNTDNEASRDEPQILRRFLEGVGKYQPLLVGFNSHAADLKILVQRAVIHGVSVPGFFKRPDKPWEPGDYFSRENDNHIDMFYLLSRGERGGPSLNEMATLSGIPGKFDMQGQDIHELLFEEHGLQKVLEYNEFDAITTYLLFLRMAYVSGFFTDDIYKDEQKIVKEFLESECIKEKKVHLREYLEKWLAMKKD
jgi:3'-5' exonuclease